MFGSALAIVTLCMVKMLVVRRGMSPAFHFFCQVFASAHDCPMVEDRRRGDRRSRDDESIIERRRYTERRRAEAQRQDFWMVGKSSAQTSLKSLSYKPDTQPQWRSIFQILR